MRVLGLDFETTSLDPQTAHIIEIGAVLWDTEKKTPLKIFNELVWDPDYPPIREEGLAHHGIGEDLLREMGKPPRISFARLDLIAAVHDPKFIVAHNGRAYDCPLLKANLKWCELEDEETPALLSLPWIDTKEDLPFDYPVSSRKLSHLAADHGFMNPFAHRAVFDVITMLRVMSYYPMEKILEYQKFKPIEAVVSFNDREKAKEAGFSWNASLKKWWKKIHPDSLVEEQKKYAFPIRFM